MNISGSAIIGSLVIALAACRAPSTKPRKEASTVNPSTAPVVAAPSQAPSPVAVAAPEPPKDRRVRLTAGELLLPSALERDGERVVLDAWLRSVTRTVGTSDGVSFESTSARLIATAEDDGRYISCAITRDSWRPESRLCRKPFPKVRVEATVQVVDWGPGSDPQITVELEDCRLSPL